MNDKTGQTNNLTGKYTMEASKLNRLQCYMTSFELEYRKIKRKPKKHQLNNIFKFTMERLFETL